MISFASSARECASSALTVALSSRISVTVPSDESFKSISRWVARASMNIDRISAEKGESDPNPASMIASSRSWSSFKKHCASAASSIGSGPALHVAAKIANESGSLRKSFGDSRDCVKIADSDAELRIFRNDFSKVNRGKQSQRGGFAGERHDYYDGTEVKEDVVCFKSKEGSNEG